MLLIVFLTLTGMSEIVNGEIAGNIDKQQIGKYMIGAPLFQATTDKVSFGPAELFESRVYDRMSYLANSDGEGYSNDAGHQGRQKRATSFSNSEIDGILNRHNSLRENVSPEASNMIYMIWDDDLASMAQDWSDTCRWEHGNPTNISPFSSVGQNLWLGTGSQPNGVEATQAWYNEVSDYDYDSHSCSAVCGHYTQVVWADSYAVGCGRTFCSSVSNGWTNAYIITCNYGPAGNYVGVRPYLTGNSCTQCGSGVGQCYQNQCRLCSEHSEPCDCRAVCRNCGTFRNNCTCACRDGFYGSDCSTTCEDTHRYCGANPGWPVSWCTDDRQYVLNGCPLMCGLCNAADPNDVCDPSAATTQRRTTKPATTSARGPTSTAAADPSTTVSTRRTTVSTRRATTTPSIPATTIGVDGTTAQSCQLTCQNDGKLRQATCECSCSGDYQGDECEEKKSEVRYGVIVLVYTSINRWPNLRDILIRIIGEIVTSWCNDNFAICCPHLGTKTTSNALSYVAESHVTVASGFPKEEKILSRDAFRVMMLVSPPQTTELCSSGSEYVASRKKRSTRDALESHLVFLRSKRQTTSDYLDQDALYQAISENVDMIEEELNVTIGEVSKGEVEETPRGGGIATWVVALIVVIVILIGVVLVVAVIAVVAKEKGKKGRSISPVPKEKDTGQPSQPTP